MKIRILAVGNEAQYQNHFDTSYQYLKKETAALSAELSYRIQRPDSAELFAALKESMQQNDAVLMLAAPEAAVASAILKVVCGGLERATSADAVLAQQLQLRAERMGHPISSEEAAAFATFPTGVTLLANPNGLVQGYAVPAKKQLLAVLPAAPSELAPLYVSEVRALLGQLADVAISYGTVRVLELDRFTVQQELDRLNQNPHLNVTSQNNRGDHEIYIEATGTTQQDADELKNTAINHMREQFGIYLYCIGNRDLPSIVTDGMTRSDLTLASAEMGTGELLRRQLSAAYGAAGYYRAAYGDEECREELKISSRLLQETKEGSAALASALAVQSRRHARTSLGLGISCSEESGQLFVAIADKNRVWNRRLALPANRLQDTAQTAVWQALNVLRLYTAQWPTPLPGGTDIKEIEKKLGGIPSLFGGKKPIPTAKPASSAKEAGTGIQKKKEKEPMKLSRKKDTKAAAPQKQAAAVTDDSLKGTNLIQRLRMKKLTKNDKIRLLALGVCAAVFIGCMIYILSEKLESIKNQQLSDELANMYNPGTTDTEVEWDGYPREYIPGFEALFARNPDIAGWVSIPDTKLNYAVVQAEDNDKYHRADIDLKYSDHGIPYVDFRCDQAKPSYNTIIYGHNMGDGTMFGYLASYKKLAYYQQHPLISYNSVYREDMYKIFAVVVCKADDPDFDYHNFVDSEDSVAKSEYLEKIMARSIIKTTVDVNPTDRLLTLSTCDYTFRDPDTNQLIARLVVFARAVREGESTDVNTTAAVLNSNPLMPQEWFDWIKKQQEKKAAEELEKEQKAYIDLWLTEDEKVGTVAEQYELAQERAALAEKYLTAAELSSGLDPQEILDTINYRERLFKMLLTAEEKNLSPSNKLALCEERIKVLQQQVGGAPLLTDQQLFASDWSQLEGRYNLLSKNSDVFLYLSVADVQNMSISSATLQSNYSANKAKAAKYLTAEQISACKDWNELSGKISQAEATRKTYEAKALELGFTQADIDKLSLSQLIAAVDKKQNQAKIDAVIAQIKVLSPSVTGANGVALADMSLDELNSLLATLQAERTTLEAEARKAGLTDSEIAACTSNDALRAAIGKKQQAKKDALITEILALEGAPDKATLEGKTLSELEIIKTDLINQANTKKTLISEIQALDPARTGLDTMSVDELKALKAQLEKEKKEKEEKAAKDAVIATIKASTFNAKTDAELAAMSLDELNAYKTTLDKAAAEKAERDSLIQYLTSKGVTDDMSSWTLDQLYAKKTEVDNPPVTEPVTPPAGEGEGTEPPASDPPSDPGASDPGSSTDPGTPAGGEGEGTPSAA